VVIGLPYYAFARTGHALRIAFPEGAVVELDGVRSVKQGAEAGARV
jgi:hypothetical protein